MMFQLLIVGAFVVAFMSWQIDDGNARTKAVGWIALGIGLMGAGVDAAIELGWTPH